MAWSELIVDVLPAQLDVVSTRLFALGTAGIQEDALEPPVIRQVWEPPSVAAAAPATPARVRLRAWFADPDRIAVEAGLRDVLPGGAPTWADVPDVPWEEAWKAEHRPLVISPRITIAPPWAAPPGSIVIEPGQGFGTGQHPTTRMVLRALDDLADEVATVLDVGCGSGLLALAGARLGLRAHGVDVEAPAVEEALANAARNQLPVTFATTPVEDLREPADLVLANVHAEVLVALAPDLVRLTGAWLVVGGILVDREAAVREALAELTLARRDEEQGWVCLRLRR